MTDDGAAKTPADMVKGFDDKKIEEGLALGMLRRTPDGKIELTEEGVSALEAAASEKWGPGATLKPSARKRFEDETNKRQKQEPPARQERARGWFRRRGSASR